MSCPVCDQGPQAPLCPAILYPGKVSTIESCGACGSAFFWPPPSADEIARCYPHSYFRDFFKQYWKDFYKGRFIGEGLALWRPRGKFLDVGCALGTLLAGVREGSGWDVAGLEYMPAAARVGKELHGIDTAIGGLDLAPWPESSFDYVHANNVLEHESRPLEALRAARRLLKPGGRLQLVLPNGPMDVRANVRLYKSAGRPVVTRHSGHLFFYSRRGLMALLERAGFRLLKLQSFHLKTALKAQGLTPGADKQFLQTVETERPRPHEPDALPMDEYRKLIPPRPSWTLYRLSTRWRRQWRWSNSEAGYDFDLTAEKV